ncbi:metallophosphoesterase [Subsaximicrobium wynnwilliamsii]|uniref:Metallophosphoesterase n=1 Tax=Subsaximicrobium wynnwilliamsii TaxID=291179 RepID=A0A5C6ZE53_9FLAO|nr:metallophosphoesterase [Subsaximicrobium wynnwilliamsii]TXD82414.1 metallophosphoesterase [Subsaximicrobium wynnwilliamsii]TXD88056.1 metallophosphoesterase [Subsaximicrobium wynnwilliamsii]TXE02082.1 metallophosphoesterase [Subsaximicrobium wynnwilliamsii]
MLRWILFVSIYILLSIYGFQAIKTLTKVTWIHYLFLGISLVVVGNFIYQFSIGSEGRVLNPAKSYAFGFLLAFMALNLILVPFLLGEDIIRAAIGIFEKRVTSEEGFHLPSRRKFISGLALGLAAIPFAGLLYGMYKGKYRFRVLDYTLHFEDLPEAFDGYRITQISDIHSGSFDNHKKIQYGVDLIKAQKSDVILFTGDMVNNKTTEMLPWVDMFSQLKAPDGVYSVLGNHDYGDYIDWPSPAAKAQNIADLVQLQKDLGFDILLNESRFIERDGQRIAIMGVENWGKGGFKKAGDLQKTKENVASNDFKILMTHDPSHWEEEVLPDDYHFHLTLSGHTHGMQFGIEIPGWIKWSPIKWRYKQWAGIYKELGQYINVNRGFGYLGYPGRVGIWPEVSVITLKKGTKEA